MKFIFKARFTFSHSIQLSKQFNAFNRQQIFQQLSKQGLKVFQGSLGAKQSKQFMQKFNAMNFKQTIHNKNLKVSSIGIGTYKGTFSQDDDIKQFNAIIDSVNMGVNVIDTCHNFRNGRSQTVIGLALQHLIKNEGYHRNNFLICSKAGYVRQNLSSYITQKDHVNDHCVHPLFLEECLDHSLNKIGVKTLDVFYLNNFSESQLQELGHELFQKHLHEAFSFCQKVRKQQKIKYYGLSSWQAFRLPPNHKNHLNLKNIVKIASKVGGVNHGFRFLQTPINVMMPQAFAQRNQPEGSLLQTAQNLKINVISNSPLLSGSLINIPMPASKLKCRNNGAKHLQFIRSIPSQSLITTLIGQKLNRHVKKNLQVLSVPPLTPEQWMNVLFPSQKANNIEQQDSQDYEEQQNSQKKMK